MKFIVTFSLLGLMAVGADPVFLESRGIVAIEAESTESRLGKWKEKTDVSDYKGECHLEFTGNTTLNGDPKSPLKYKFQISKGGVYRLTIRGRKRLQTQRQDISNDCYVAVSGDFEAGGKAPLRVLKNDTKMFGGKADSWGWTKELDVNHQKYPAEYRFKEGEEYELTISGRSKNFNIDRILFVHSDIGLREAWKDNPKESKRRSGLAGSSFKPRVQRELTDKEGRKVTAILISKNEGILTAIVNGRRHQISFDTLSKADQKFLRQWKP